LGGKVIKIENSKFKPNGKKKVVNWGSLSLPREFAQEGIKVLNPSNLVKNASNKALFFNLIKSLPEEERPSIPDFTFSKDEVKEWFNDPKTKMVFARTVLNGHSGEGIVKIDNAELVDDRFADNTLFVKYVPKKREFRVHVSKLGVFLVQEKLRKLQVEDQQVDFQIRNAANGFVFARTEVEIPELCLEEAKKTLVATGLDFAAMDIIYNERQEKAYVLEANTAPGLEGSTIQNYSDEIRKLLADV